MPMLLMVPLCSRRRGGWCKDSAFIPSLYLLLGVTAVIVINKERLMHCKRDSDVRWRDRGMLQSKSKRESNAMHCNALQHKTKPCTSLTQCNGTMPCKRECDMTWCKTTRDRVLWHERELQKRSSSCYSFLLLRLHARFKISSIRIHFSTAYSTFSMCTRKYGECKILTFQSATY